MNLRQNAAIGQAALSLPNLLFHAQPMKTLSYLLSACLLLLSTGCVNFSNLDKSATLTQDSSDAVIVMGVKPRFRVAIAPGTIVEEKVKLGGIATLNTYPESGYIVGKVAAAVFPNEYHVQAIFPDGIVGAGFGDAYGPCGNDHVVSFHAPAGKVIYVGDVEYARANGKLVIKYSEDLQSARKFLDREYPNLANRLEAPGLQTRPVAFIDCGKRVTIQVLVPRGR